MRKFCLYRSCLYLCTNDCLRVPDAPLEVVLADELQDSLRALRPEGNLLKDRYRNMLLNGKMETRRTMQHKKPKREVTEKWSYKDWKLR
jgi:nucleolar protein 53